MPTNRHAQIRYTVLDRCFSNFNKEYTYQDLLNEVNKVLHELGTEGIQLRQLQYDIAHMKSDAGYCIEWHPRIPKKEHLSIGIHIDNLAGIPPYLIIHYLKCKLIIHGNLLRV